MIRALAIAALGFASAADAGSLRLGFPVECKLGETCFIQNYVDHDPSKNFKDFSCGSLSYDGHSGTDIALIDMQAMRSGVAVFPSAPGTVRATRDDMPDININDPGAPDITNRACGNAVIVDHGGGWTTRYCHLKRGSVSVKVGDRVNLSTEIGDIGLSGRTSFPHLHVTLTKDGKIVDPFSSRPTASCGEADESIWVEGVTYQSGGLLSAGFSSALPKFEDIKSGTAAELEFSATAKAIVIWAHVFGARIDDRIEFSIDGPTGSFLERTVTLDRTQARAFRAVGRSLKTDGWPNGTYIGHVRMWRGDKQIGKTQVALTITN